MNPSKQFLILSLWAVGASALSAATTIYSDDFSGSTSSLNGANPDTTSGYAGGTSGATWGSSSLWHQDGNRNSTTDGYAKAWLPFTPEVGHIYTAKIDIDVTNETNRYFYMGFSSTGNTGDGTGPLNDGVLGFALVRGNVAYDNGGTLNEVSTYPTDDAGDADPVPTSTLDPAGQGEIEIVLDTRTSGSWSASWYFTPTNGSRALLHTETSYSQSISYIGFGSGANGGGGGFAKGSVDNFLLEADSALGAVPEPSNATLLGLLLGAGLLRRKRLGSE